MTDKQQRRQFLKFLAASPLLGYTAAGRLLADEMLVQVSLPNYLIQSPDEALDVFDFHNVAKRVLPTAHYGYMATGTDGNETLKANRDAFERVYLRSMRMVDTSNVRLDQQLLDEKMSSPIVLAPVSSQKAFHAEGEVASARAAKSQGHLQILSNATSTSIEDVIEARGEPVWFQFYPTNKWSTASTMLRRAEDAGAKVVVLTVDLNSDSNRVLLSKFVRADDRDCNACHVPGPDGWLATKPMYAGTGSKSADWDTSGMTWDYIDRLRNATSMKIVVKGIVTEEDAKSCIDAGVDAIYVSNHGGRAEASGWGSLESLPEVVAASDGRVPVLIDSGFRRGTDIFKALAMGADAVCLGRAYIWGLAAFGQPGVEKVLDMLNAELRMVMGQMGARSIGDIGMHHIGVRG